MANTLVFAGQTISDDHIFGGVSYLADLNTGEEFSIGNTASASVSFVTDIRLPIYTKDPENGTSTWTQGTNELADNNSDLLVDENNNSFVIETPRGRFYITEVTKSEGFYTVTAYDAMILLETNISALSLTFPLTVSTAASAIAAYIGCTVSGTVNNGTLSVSELNEDMTIRELLGYVAEASGCSVKIDGSDHLCFMYYGDSGITLTASEYKKLEVADYVCAAIDNVTILNSVGAAIATAGSGTNTLYIEANPFLEEATNTEAALILSLVEDFEYAPLTCDLFDADDLEIGTIVTFGETPTLVMHLESSEDGAVVSSVGSDSRAEFNKSIETMLAAVSKEALEAADEAAKTATTYITDIDAKHGITIKPSDSSGNDYLMMNSNAIAFYRNSTANSCMNLTDDTFRVGLAASGHSTVKADGLHVWTGTESTAGNEVAFFGSSARIGASGSARAEIGSANGMNVFDSDNNLRANFSSTGVSIFDTDGTNITQIGSGTAGAGVRIGDRDDYNIYVNDTGVAFREGLTSRFKISSSTSDGYTTSNLGSATSYSNANISTIVGAASGKSGATAQMQVTAPDGASNPSASVTADRSSTRAQASLISKYSDSKSAMVLAGAESANSIVQLSADRISASGDIYLDGIYKCGTGGVKLITIDTVTIDNISIPANGSATDESVSAAKSNYTPIGVVGYVIANATSSGTGGGNCALTQARIVNSDAVFSIKNVSSSAAKVRVIANILYIASIQGV